MVNPYRSQLDLPMTVDGNPKMTQSIQHLWALYWYTYTAGLLARPMNHHNTRIPILATDTYGQTKANISTQHCASNYAHRVQNASIETRVTKARRAGTEPVAAPTSRSCQRARVARPSPETEFKPECPLCPMLPRSFHAPLSGRVKCKITRKYHAIAFILMETLKCQHSYMQILSLQSI